MPELRKDPVIGRWVIIATERGKRPTDFVTVEQAGGPVSCPFCEGNEHMTPPVIAAYPTEKNWEIRIVENLYLTSAKVRTWIRVPLIPGYNDSEKNIGNLINLAKESKAEKVSLLPYHEYGRGKYKQLGRHYRLGKIESPSDEQIQRIQKLFQEAGVNATINY